MPSFSPTVTVNTTPAVLVTSSGANTPTYEEIRRSLGDNVYNAFEVYFASNNFQQISGVLQFNKYDSNGNITNYDIVPFVSPYQKQKTLFFQLDAKETVIDGRNTFKFPLLPNTALNFKVFMEHVSVETFVEDNGKNTLGESNFQKFETATGLFDFFNSFNPSINWRDSNKVVPEQKLYGKKLN
jgi:hypothetical protein